jgi:hypothetical protein
VFSNAASWLVTASFRSLATMDRRLIPELSGIPADLGRGGVLVDEAINGGCIGCAGVGGFVLDMDGRGAGAATCTGVSNCIRTTPA